jgi:tetratricopeptide (TPR) repeat protein
MLAFFDENPFIPLRVFITSRVEQHIHSRLNVPGVRLDNLGDHCSDDDITAFLSVLFQDAGRRNPVVQAHIRERGEWPTPSDKRKLVQHISGSFIFAWAVFKFIMGYNTSRNQRTTPMDRLPLALKMNPGLDGLYAETLERSEDVPHFLNVISTIALLETPLPTSGIAEVLGIRTCEVVNVLVDLQAIIQVPGTDDIPVTLCHTSLRDFLTTQNRSGRFFAHPRHHARLYLRLIQCEYELRRRRQGVAIHLIECTPAIAYSRRYSVEHLNNGQAFLEKSEAESAIRLCREMLRLHPDSPELIQALADAIYWSEPSGVSGVDLEEAISLYRQALLLRPLADEGRWLTLHTLGFALESYHSRTRDLNGLAEAISVCQEALKLRPSPHSDRSDCLHQLSGLLKARYHRSKAMADLEKAISLYREALELQPTPHPNPSTLPNNLAISLRDRYQRTKAMADLEEAISLEHEALELRSSTHPCRSKLLWNLSMSLRDMYGATGRLSDLQESITHCEELIDCHYLVGHECRVETLNQLAFLLKKRFDATGQQEDLARIDVLEEEASRSSKTLPM